MLPPVMKNRATTVFSHSSLIIAFVALTACGGMEGQQGIEEEDPIVGGSATTVEQNPWQISLQTSSGSHFCGGSIVAADWVLTANHCVEGSSASSMRIVAGITRRSQSSTGQIR